MDERMEEPGRFFFVLFFFFSEKYFLREVDCFEHDFHPDFKSPHIQKGVEFPAASRHHSPQVSCSIQKRKMGGIVDDLLIMHP